MRRWFTKLQIRFAFYMLRRSFPKPLETQQSVSSNTVMDSSDPCHLEVDAAAQSVTEINEIMDNLQAAMELSFQRAQLLYQCRLDNPGSGSEGGGGPVGP